LQGMGNKLGYSYSYVSDIERGKAEPSRAFLKRVSEIFALSIDYILYGDSLDQVRILFSPMKERIEQLKKEGVMPRASLHDDEMAIIKLLRALSMKDSIAILERVISNVAADPLIPKDDYLIQNIERVKTMIEKGHWESGLDFDGMLWGLEILQKRREEAEILDSELHDINERIRGLREKRKRLRSLLKRMEKLDH